MPRHKASSDTRFIGCSEISRMLGVVRIPVCAALIEVTPRRLDETPTVDAFEELHSHALTGVPDYGV